MKTLFIFIGLLIPGIMFCQKQSVNSNNLPASKKTDFSIKTPSCDELIYYRDVTLIGQFDQATKEYILKYKLDNDAIKDIKKYRTELLNERGWDELMSTGTALSEGGVTLAQIARIIKMNCDLIQGMIEMIPAEHLAVATAKQTILTAEQAFKTIKAGKDLKEVVEGNLEMVGVKVVLDEMNIAGKAAKAALEFSVNMDELIKIPEEREKLKSEVERILDMLDNALARYQEDLEKSTEKLKQAVNAEQGITRYLNENCKNSIASTKPKTPIKKDPETRKTLSASDNSEKTMNSCYIFFTTSIEIKPKPSQFSNLQTPKTLYIISAPILFIGNMQDPMVVEKDQFLSDIESQFPDKPESLKDLLKTRDYNNIQLHFGKPYSSTRLKTIQEGVEAIEAYKMSQHELLDGLIPFDFFELKKNNN